MLDVGSFSAVRVSDGWRVSVILQRYKSTKRIVYPVIVVHYTNSLIVQWFVLPDTEGHTLEDIEVFFSDNSRKFSDTRIKRTSVKTQNAAFAADETKVRKRPLSGTFVQDLDGASQNDGPPAMRYDNKAFV